MEGRIIPPGTQNPINMEIAENIKKNILPNLRSLDGKDLWEFLVRNVAQPQLMTPNKVSLGMKGIELDSSPILP